MKDATGAEHQIPDSYWLAHGGAWKTCPHCQQRFIGLNDEFAEMTRVTIGDETIIPPDLCTACGERVPYSDSWLLAGPITFTHDDEGA